MKKKTPLMGRMINERGQLITESVDYLNEVMNEGGDWLIGECTSYITCDLNESSKASGPLKFKGKFQEANAVNKNRRMYPREILESNLKRLKETISNRGLIAELDHPCLTTSDFNVLTVNGWKPFTSIREGDYVYSRVDGKMIKSRVNKIIDKPYDGPAYEFKGRSIDCTFTPDHRVLLHNRYEKNQFYATVKEIYVDRKKYNKNSIPKTANWEGSSTKTFTLQSSDRPTRKDCSEPLVFEAKKFTAFLGIYLAEGCLKNKNRVEICQKNEVGKKLIKEMLSKLHSDLEWKECSNGFYVNDARLYEYLIPLGNKYSKYIPKEVKQLSSECLETLLLWFAIGDGRIIKDKEKDGGKRSGKCESVKSEISVDNGILDFGVHSRTDVFSVSKQLVDDLHECLLKTGRCGSRSVIMPDKDYEYAGRIIKAENKSPLYQLHISRSKNIHMESRFMKVSETHHTGRIYCLSVDNGNFYMERKGKSFWTGNCDSIVHLENASHIVTKLWWEGSTVMGEGEVLDTPSGKVLRGLINSGVRVGISSRGVGNGTTNEDGVLVIGESYKLITFDAVADPSTFSAFQQKIVSNESNNYRKNDDVPEKNEASRINKINARALITFLGCLFENKTNEIKERLHS